MNDEQQPKPGDEAPPQDENTGQDVCPDCEGTGKAGDDACPTCRGTGTVAVAVGGG